MADQVVATVMDGSCCFEGSVGRMRGKRVLGRLLDDLTVRSRIGALEVGMLMQAAGCSLARGGEIPVRHR